MGNAASGHPLKHLTLDVHSFGGCNADSLHIRDDHICLLLQALPESITAVQISGIQIEVDCAYGELRRMLNRRGSLLAHVEVDLLEDDHCMPTQALAERNRLRSHWPTSATSKNSTSTLFVLGAMAGKLKDDVTVQDSQYQNTKWTESFHNFVRANLEAQHHEGGNIECFFPEWKPENEVDAYLEAKHHEGGNIEDKVDGV